MVTKKTSTSIEKMLEQWTQERPDLNLSSMATIGRLKKSSALVQSQLEEVFAKYSLTAWEFDVLATLRRSGKPYSLAPTTLFSSLMITSGTMTHRMNRLESRGLVKRINNPEDARSKLVQLTDEALELIEQAVEGHVENEQSLLSRLNESDLKALNQGLQALLESLEQG